MLFFKRTRHAIRRLSTSPTALQTTLVGERASIRALGTQHARGRMIGMAQWSSCCNSFLRDQYRQVSFSYSRRIPCVQYDANTRLLAVATHQPTLPPQANICVLDSRPKKDSKSINIPKTVQSIVMAHMEEKRKAAESGNAMDRHTAPLVIVIKSPHARGGAAQQQHALNDYIRSFGAMEETRVCILDSQQSRELHNYLAKPGSEVAREGAVASEGRERPHRGKEVPVMAPNGEGGDASPLWLDTLMGNYTKTSLTQPMDEVRPNDNTLPHKFVEEHTAGDGKRTPSATSRTTLCDDTEGAVTQDPAEARINAAIRAAMNVEEEERRVASLHDPLSEDRENDSVRLLEEFMDDTSQSEHETARQSAISTLKRRKTVKRAHRTKFSSARQAHQKDPHPTEPNIVSDTVIHANLPEATLYDGVRTTYLSDRARIDLPVLANVLVVDRRAWSVTHKSLLDEVDNATSLAKARLLDPSAYRHVQATHDTCVTKTSLLPYIIVFRTGYSSMEALGQQQQLFTLQRGLDGAERGFVCVLDADESKAANPLCPPSRVARSPSPQLSFHNGRTTQKAPVQPEDDASSLIDQSGPIGARAATEETDPSSKTSMACDILVDSRSQPLVTLPTTPIDQQKSSNPANQQDLLSNRMEQFSRTQAMPSFFLPLSFFKGGPKVSSTSSQESRPLQMEEVPVKDGTTEIGTDKQPAPTEMVTSPPAEVKVAPDSGTDNAAPSFSKGEDSFNDTSISASVQPVVAQVDGNRDGGAFSAEPLLVPCEPSQRALASIHCVEKFPRNIHVPPGQGQPFIMSNVRKGSLRLKLSVSAAEAVGNGLPSNAAVVKVTKPYAAPLKRNPFECPVPTASGMVASTTTFSRQKVHGTTSRSLRVKRPLKHREGTTARTASLAEPQGPKRKRRVSKQKCKVEASPRRARRKRSQPSDTTAAGCQATLITPKARVLCRIPAKRKRSSPKKTVLPRSAKKKPVKPCGPPTPLAMPGAVDRMVPLSPTCQGIVHAVAKHPQMPDASLMKRLPKSLLEVLTCGTLVYSHVSRSSLYPFLSPPQLEEAGHLPSSITITLLSEKVGKLKHTKRLEKELAERTLAGMLLTMVREGVVQAGNPGSTQRSRTFAFLVRRDDGSKESRKVLEGKLRRALRRHVGYKRATVFVVSLI